MLLVGFFGNISDAEVHTTINASAQLYAPGATLVWSRGRNAGTGGDRNTAVRAWFAEAGFSEIGYHTRDTGSLPALGAARYDGAPQPWCSGNAGSRSAAEYHHGWSRGD